MNNFIKMATTFIAELAKKGATEDELWEAIQFSSELIDLSKKHRICDLTNKYNIEDILTESKTPNVIYDNLKVTPLSPSDYCNMVNKVRDDFNKIWEQEAKQNDDT